MQPSRLQRAGLWRRGLALFVDAVIVGVVLQILAVAVFHLSDAILQYPGAVAFELCEPRAEIPREMVREPRPGMEAEECERSLFGLTHAHVVRVFARNKDGSVDKSTLQTAGVNRAGQSIRAYNLDVLTIPLLLLFRWWFDGGAGSPGRQAVRIRVVRSLEGGLRAAMPDERQLAKRSAILIGLFLPSLALQVIGTFDADLSDWWNWLHLVPVVAVIVIVVQIVLRWDTFYDGWAGTIVAVVSKEQQIALRQPRPTATVA